MRRLSIPLILALAAACAPAAAPAPAPSSAPAHDMAGMGGFPMATYTTTLVDADVPASAPADLRSGVVGAWEITFGPGGQGTAMYNGRQVVAAPYTVSGNEITFTDDSGEYACHSTGRYTWHATATELHLTRISDDCTGRVLALTSHPLVRKP